MQYEEKKNELSLMPFIVGAGLSYLIALSIVVAALMITQ